MGKNSAIQWTTHTFNPWIGCQKVSEGCDNCYAHDATFVRVQRSEGRELWGNELRSERHVTSDANWDKPRRWNREAREAGTRARVFCASLADVFEDRKELAFERQRLWDLIEATPHLDWQLLTKRPENVMYMAPIQWGLSGFPDNVWIGTSVENQERADERIPELLKIPARIRFLSCEPLLGPVDLARIVLGESAARMAGHPSVERARFTINALTGVRSLGWPAVSWVIVGGESGPDARPMDVRWARRIVEQCRATGVPVFVKQIGARPYESPRHYGGTGYMLPVHHKKGGDPSEWPEDLRVREMPE